MFNPETQTAEITLKAGSLVTAGLLSLTLPEDTSFTFPATSPQDAAAKCWQGLGDNPQAYEDAVEDLAFERKNAQGENVRVIFGAFAQEEEIPIPVKAVSAQPVAPKPAGKGKDKDKDADKGKEKSPDDPKDKDKRV